MILSHPISGYGQQHIHSHVFVPFASSHNLSSSAVFIVQKDEEERQAPDLPTLLRRLWKVAAPYWFSDDKTQARLRLAVLFVLSVATTGISVQLSFLGRDFFNALAKKDQAQFTKQLLYNLLAFAGAIPVIILRNYVEDTLALRWRSWMTSYYMERYLNNKNQTYYKIQSQSIIDNPDQRIVDDLKEFTRRSLSFSLIILRSVLDLLSFSKILYDIYPSLFVVLVVYSVGGTAISLYLGRDLVTLNFLQEKKEADFRYGLVRVRENAESIAFYSGEETEVKILTQRFRSAFENLSRLLISERNLELFTSSYSYLIGVLPAAVVAPIPSVPSQLSSIDLKCHSKLLGVENLTLETPRSRTTLIRDLWLEVNKEDHLLIKGPSGSGKTSLLRAMAGLWSTGQGRITFYVKDAENENHQLPLSSSEVASLEVPTESERYKGKGRSKDIFFLPQKPYMVLGTLRQQLLYPTWSEKLERDKLYQPKEDDELVQVLEDVRLGYVLSRFNGLDSTYEWSSVLSLGEQQRLAFARVLLSKPKLVLLDEATSALDEANEVHLYKQIEAAGITYISVGHRRTLYDYHNRVLHISKKDTDSGSANGHQRNWFLKPIMNQESTGVEEN
ncbi:ABC transporter-like [Macleaya cordata]|uniref:ABC transporter-like n=1 Tax=Macleaya cordata TaxID=56857 RepID=A0A200QU21_MACCD|nr:ABC transporter-like [Macleaya cordata]